MESEMYSWPREHYTADETSLINSMMAAECPEYLIEAFLDNRPDESTINVVMKFAGDSMFTLQQLSHSLFDYKKAADEIAEREAKLQATVRQLKDEVAKSNADKLRLDASVKMLNEAITQLRRPPELPAPPPPSASAKKPRRKSLAQARHISFMQRQLAASHRRSKFLRRLASEKDRKIAKLGKVLEASRKESWKYAAEVEQLKKALAISRDEAEKNEKNHRLEERLTSLQERCNLLSSRLEAKKEEVSVNETRLSECRRKIDSLQADLDKSRASSAKSAAAAATTTSTKESYLRIRNLEARASRLESENAGLCAKLQEFEELEQENDCLRDYIDELHTRLHQQRVTSLDQRLGPSNAVSVANPYSGIAPYGKVSCSTAMSSTTSSVSSFTTNRLGSTLHQHHQEQHQQQRSVNNRSVSALSNYQHPPATRQNPYA